MRTRVVRRYVVMVAHDPELWESASDAVTQEYSGSHQAFEEFVDAHGRRVSWAPLAGGDTATTIRRVDGVATVIDGPWVQSVEQIGGYYDVELPDLDTAIEAGRLLPMAYVVEIRPVVALEEQPSQ